MKDKAWHRVNCPNCGHLLARNQETKFSFEVQCNSCKGIYVVANGESGEVCFTEARQPKRRYSPSEYK